MAEANIHQHPGDTIDYTPVAAVLAGDVVQLADGRAAVCPTAIAAGDTGIVQIGGIITVPGGLALLKGGDVYWDVSLARANFKADSGTPDYYLGTAAADHASGTAVVYVNLNARANYTIDLSGGDAPDWTVGSVAGTTATTINLPGGVAQINILATNEAQGAAIVSNHGVLGSAKPIFEARIAQFAASGSTIDVDFGLATGSHATDFEAVTAFAAFHMDGGNLELDTHSDDGTTDRAPLYSDYDYTDDNYLEYWIDARDDTNVKFYLDGVLVDTSSTKRILTAALTSTFKAIAMVEKTTGTETAELRVSRMRVRTQGQ